MPSHKNSIQLTILQNGNGQYVAQEGKVKPIGNKRKKNVFWDITNRTNNPIVVTIHKFNHKPPCDPQSPCPCPLEDKGDFKNCAARDLRIDDQEGNRTRTIEAKISEDAGSCYTYELFVANASTNTGNCIDPELQIDDDRILDHLKKPVVIVIIIVAVAFAVLWYW